MGGWENSILILLDFKGKGKVNTLLFGTAESIPCPVRMDGVNTGIILPILPLIVTINLKHTFANL